jgi:hypothetical protein
VRVLSLDIWNWCVQDDGHDEKKPFQLFDLVNYGRHRALLSRDHNTMETEEEQMSPSSSVWDKSAMRWPTLALENLNLSSRCDPMQIINLWCITPHLRQFRHTKISLEYLPAMIHAWPLMEKFHVSLPCMYLMYHHHRSI